MARDMVPIIIRELKLFRNKCEKDGPHSAAGKCNTFVKETRCMYAIGHIIQAHIFMTSESGWDSQS